MSAFRDQVEGERAYLIRYATLQLRDAAAAEDAVQETLLAALAGESGFAGRSNLRTWLTGILKHKIVDAIRRMSRETAIGADEDGYPGILGYQGPPLSEVAASDVRPLAPVIEAMMMRKSEREIELISESARWCEHAH